MSEIIVFNDIIFDNSLIMAIIAINMTIIGLTSLAETKNIVGVDYGKFLIQEYKLMNVIRIYYLLILFAIINVCSLFLMFVQSTPFRVVNLLVLILSLIFAIFYFFAYIIIENKGVKNQIYERELLGLYYSSNKQTNFVIDKLVKMNNGSITHKKVSGNIISYFNQLNSQTQHTFEEIFGKDSIIYNNSNKMKRKIMRRYLHSPYEYKTSETGIKDISHEYFQLFRFSELQDKWTIDILRLINGKKEDNLVYDRFRLYNFSRVITHINVFGYAESLYKYKFLEFIIDSYCEAVSIKPDELHQVEDQEKLLEIEKHTLDQLLTYMFSTIKKGRGSFIYEFGNNYCKGCFFKSADRE